jgi:DNA-binding LytR/AlgR family response regulator
MRIAICDDTEQDLKNLYNLISLYSKQNNFPITIDTYNDSNVLLNHITYFKENEYVLFFLDIIMQDNGINVASQIRQNYPDVPIIFTTSSKEYAIDAFKVRAYDYILKPVAKNELFECLDKLTKTIKSNQKSAFSIKIEDLSYVTININEICFIEQKDRRIVYHMNNNKVYVSTSIRGKFIDEIPFEFTNYNFINCHHSFVVNMNQIVSIDDYSFTMKNGDNIPISKRTLKAVRDEYVKYLLGD